MFRLSRRPRDWLQEAFIVNRIGPATAQDSGDQDVPTARLTAALPARGVGPSPGPSGTPNHAISCALRVHPLAAARLADERGSWVEIVRPSYSPAALVGGYCSRRFC